MKRMPTWLVSEYADYVPKTKTIYININKSTKLDLLHEYGHYLIDLLIIKKYKNKMQLIFDKYYPYRIQKFIDCTLKLDNWDRRWNF
jgi:hypothetical protein